MIFINIQLQQSLSLLFSASQVDSVPASKSIVDVPDEGTAGRELDEIKPADNGAPEAVQNSVSLCPFSNCYDI